jgi:hypothetical protein
MSGEPNSFIHGPRDKFGDEFGVPLTRTERRIRDAMTSPTARARSSEARRARAVKPTKAWRDKPEAKAKLDAQKLRRCINELIGLQFDLQERTTLSAQPLRNVLRWLTELEERSNG